MDFLRSKSGRIILALLVLIAFIAMAGKSQDYTSASENGSKTSFFKRWERGSERLTGIFQSGKSKSGSKSGEGGGKSAAAKTEAAAAQTSTTLTGTIFNENNAILAGAVITVRKAGTYDVVKTGNSNDKGIYSIDSLQPDTYDILAAHPKFVSLIRPNFTILPQNEKVLFDFILPLGATINGVVLNEENQPIEGARIASRKNKSEPISSDGKILTDDSTYNTQVTDTRGTFTLEGIAMGSNVFEVAAPGYTMERMIVDMTPEKAAEQFKVTLKRNGILLGKIIDENGDPVSTASVSLTRYKPLKGKEVALDKAKNTVITNADGNFKFEKLFNEGYYDVMVEEGRFAPGIYPQVLTNSQNIVWTLQTGGSMSGTTVLIDRETQPVSVNVRAEAVIKGTTFTLESKSDGNGFFEFEKVPYAAYKLYVSDGKYVSEPRDPVNCEKDKPIADLKLELYEAAILKGKVVDSSTQKSVAYAKVNLKSTYGPLNNKSKDFSTFANAHGEFYFYKLPSGLQVAGAEAKGYLKGNTGKTQQSFFLVPGETKSDLTLLLDHGGSVEGFVVDAEGRSVQGSEVQLYLANAFDGGIDISQLKGTTDGTGYFKIWGIEVGERVQLFASARKEGFTKTRSDMIELTDKTMDVSTQIRLSKGGVITGIVTDQENLPISGAEITFSTHAFPGDPSPGSIVVHTQSNGTYQIRNAPPGGGSVSVSAASFVAQGRGVSIRDGEPTANVNFQLQKGQFIKGRVIDLQNKPIAGAKVRANGVSGAQGSEEAVTDKHGKYELKNLGKGSFNLTATFKIKTPDGDQNYTFVKTKVPVNTISADIECDIWNSASGKVMASVGGSIKNFHISLRSKSGGDFGQDFTFNLDKGFTNGFYRFVNIPRGIYDINVRADGYEPHTEEKVAIGPHTRTQLFEIRLKPAGGVVGSVFSATTDRPVHNASVRLVEVDSKKSVSGSTDLRGNFRIASVPEGLYKVAISHPAYTGTELDYIQVTEKRERDLGKLYLDAGGAIRGTIVNERGDPLPNINISISGVTPAKSTTTDGAGNYMVQGVQFGRWPMVIKGRVNSRQVYTYRSVDVMKDETKKLDITLETSADLNGMLVASAENPINSANIKIHPYDENRVALDSISYGAEAQNNSFDIKQVPPGQYFLWVSGYGRISSFTAWKELFLNRGHNQTTIEAPSAKIGGTITANGAGVPGVGVQLYPMMGDIRLKRGLYNQLIRAGVTNENGQFVFDMLQAGNYQIIQEGASGIWNAQSPFGIGNGQQNMGFNLVWAP